MDVELIAVPYDSALRGFRMGAGPDALLSAGLAAKLRTAGHLVHLSRIEADDSVSPAEIRTAFDLNRTLARAVRAASERGALPVVLAGNCNTAVGTLAGLDRFNPAVLWFDCHGDFNTPETTLGGFLDGMALAIVTGRCWTQLAGTVPGFRPAPDHQVVILGVRELDPLERDLLADSSVKVLPPDGVREELDAAVRTLREHTPDAYVHIDLDVLDPDEARANGYSTPGGLGIDELCAALAAIAERLTVRAVAFTAYDPAFDGNGAVGRAAMRALNLVLAAMQQPKVAGLR